MKEVYLLRHGSDGIDNRLDERGIEQITKTGKEIKGQLGDIGEVTIYHSPTGRTEHSARVLAETILPIRTRLESREELMYDGIDIVEAEIDSIGIIVSHQHDIKIYLELVGVPYSDCKLRNGEYRKVTVE